MNKRILKGKTGEDICINYLKSKGVTPYKFDGFHKFDGIIEYDGKICLYDVKAKTAMKSNNGNRVTGFNLESYRNYRDISKKNNIQFFVFFIDHIEQAIYGNFLEELYKGDYKYYYRGKLHTLPAIITPYNGDRIIVFSVKNMKHIDKLNINDCILLNNLSKRKVNEIQPKLF